MFNEVNHYLIYANRKLSCINVCIHSTTAPFGFLMNPIGFIVFADSKSVYLVGEETSNCNEQIGKQSNVKDYYV